MTKQIASLTRKASMEINPGQWETAEASFSIEDEVPEGANRESHGAALRASVKAQVDEEMKRQKEELFSPGSPVVNLEYEGTDFERVGVAAVDIVAAADEMQRLQAEEKPPLPGEFVTTEEIDAGLENAPKEVRTPISEPEIPFVEPVVRTPISDDGEELKSFRVDYFIIHESEHGSKYAKVHGGPVKKYGASAWGEVMEALVDISDLDVGQKFDPPYNVKAFCTTSEKGFPNKVMYFERG